MNYEEKLQIIQTGCPKLRFSAQFTDQSSQWNYSRHAHPYLELLYFTEGGGGIDVSGQRLCAGILDTIVYPAGWEHQEQASAARKREIICLWIELPELQLENRSRSGIMITCSEGCFPISTARPAGRMRRSMCWNMA